MASLKDIWIRILADDGAAKRTIRAISSSADKLGSKQVNVKVGVDKTTADLQMRALRSDLQKLERTRVNIPIRASRIDADIEATKKKLQELQRPTTYVSIEARDAASREIDKLKRDLARLEQRKVNIPVNLENVSGQIEATKAQLRALERNKIHIPVEIDTNNLNQAARGFAGLMKFPAAVAGVGVAAGGLSAVAGGLIAITSAAAPAAGALAAVGGAGLAAAQGVGVAAVAFVGVGDALKAMSAADAAAGPAAQAAAAARVSAANQIKAAQRSLEDAVRSERETTLQGARQIKAAVQGLADARVAAAERTQAAQERLADVQSQVADRVEAAEERLSSAQRASRDAQQDLNRAREDAKQKLADLVDELKGASLSEEDAALGLERAQTRLTKLREIGAKASSIDYREADLNVRQAQQRLQEVQERHRELSAEVAQANKAGIDGAAGVIQARERAVDAQRDEAKAAEEVRDAQVEGAKDIAKAERDLRKSQVEGARDIAKAQENVSEARRQAAQQQAAAARQVIAAQEQLKQAQASAAAAANKQTAAQEKLAAAMAAISPKAREFAKYLKGSVIPALKGLQFAVQDAFFPKFQAAVKRTMTLLPIFKKGAAETAEVLGDLSLQGAKLITSGPFKRDFKTLLGANKDILKIFGRVGLNVLDMIRNLAIAAIPITKRFAEFAEKVSELGKAFFETQRKSGGLERFFKTAGDAMAQLGRTAGNLIGAFFNIGKAGSDAGQGLLDSFEGATKKFKDLTGSAEGQNKLKKYFDNAAEATKAVGRLINDIVVALVDLGANKSLAPLIDQIRTKLVPAIKDLLDSFISSDLGPKIVDFLTDLVGVFKKLTDGGGSLSSFVGVLDQFAETFKKLLDSKAGPFIDKLLEFAGSSAAFLLVAGSLVKVSKAIYLVEAATWAWAAAQWAVNAAMRKNPIGIIIVALAALGTAFAVAWSKSDKFQSVVKTTWRAVWSATKVAVKAAVGFLVLLGKSFKQVWDDIRGAVHRGVDAVLASFRWLGRAGKAVWNATWGAVKKTASSAWRGVTSGTQKATDKILGLFRSTKRGIGRIWAGVVDVVKKPIVALFRWLNEHLIHNINNVTGKLKIPPISDLPTKFAKGGPVSGPGGPESDLIPARLSNGEFVVRAAQAKKFRPLLESINAGEGAGGVLDTLKDAAKKTRRGARSLGEGFVRGNRVIGNKVVGFAADGYENLAGKILDPIVNGLRARFPDPGVLTRIPVEAMARAVDTVKTLGRGADAVATGDAPASGSLGPLLGAIIGKVLGGVSFPLPRGSYRVGVPLGGYPGHTGQDFPTPIGTPVFSPITGLLRSTNLGNRSYGRYVKVVGANGLTSIQAHLSRFAHGDGIVRAGQLVGYSGSSGNSTGPHLHQEFRRGGHVINPRQILKFDAGGLMLPGQMGVNLGKRPERVLRPRDSDNFGELVQLLRGGLLDRGKGRGPAVGQLVYNAGGGKRAGRDLFRDFNNAAVEHGWGG